LVAGLVYRIKVRAINEIGASDFSDIIQVALINAPTKPSAPYKVLELSNETTITVRWD